MVFKLHYVSLNSNIKLKNFQKKKKKKKQVMASYSHG